MSVDGPRTSVFTFESAVHSHHVLRSLDELRRKGILCDLKVEVESRSFRAHSSVLASCSDYFYTRLANNSRPNLTVSLPVEVMLIRVGGLNLHAFNNCLSYHTMFILIKAFIKCSYLKEN